MQPQPFDLLVAFLVTWRISHFLIEEPGPLLIGQKIRRLAGIEHDMDGRPLSYPDNILGDLFGCMYCMSIWIAPIAIVLAILVWPIAWVLAASTGAIFIDSVIHKLDKHG